MKRRSVIFDLVPQAVAIQAAETPDAIAVTDATETLTYRELARRAGRLADALRAFEVGPDTVVAICLERSAAFVVAALGVLQAGAAYLPIDPAAPPDRLAFMLEDAAPRVTITDSRLATPLPYSAWPRLDVHEVTAGPGQPAAHHDVVKQEHLAYVIYTSGSTGRPKGVEITHGSLANLVTWHRRAFGVTADARAPLYARPPSARSTTAACGGSTTHCRPCRPARPASSISAARGWRVATAAVPTSRPSASWRTPTTPAPACTARATACGCSATDAWRSSAASTIR